MRWQEHLQNAPGNCEAEGHRAAARAKGDDAKARDVAQYTRRAERLRAVYASGSPAAFDALADDFDKAADALRRATSGAGRYTEHVHYRRCLVERHAETAYYLRLGAKELRSARSAG